METYLGNKSLNTSIFDIPTKLGHAPPGSTHGLSIIGQVVQVVLVVSGIVQPRGGP